MYYNALNRAAGTYKDMDERILDEFDTMRVLGEKDREVILRAVFFSG